MPKAQSPKPLPTKDDIIRILREHMPELRREYNVSYLGLFGSYVRGEQRQRSDVDVLVDYKEIPDLLTYIELQFKLGDLLNRKVDLVMRDSLRPLIGKQILDEVEPI